MNAITDVFSDYDSIEEAAESVLGDDDLFILHNQQSGDGEEHYATQVNGFECC